MPRYFIELSYKGTRFSGFQVQENAVTVQSEVANAFEVLHRRKVELTGSSRTDAGVHALQNFFHFDTDEPVHPQAVYKMNAILPKDVVVRGVYPMPPGAHSRFDAIGRKYLYKIHRFKNPFLQDTSYYYPYALNLPAMQEAADWLKDQTNFFSFSKTNTQVKSFLCTVRSCTWEEKGEELFFQVEANRFLRGMVRLLTATMLKIGRGKLSLPELQQLVAKDGKAAFSAPAHGLYLVKVEYPPNYFSISDVAFTGF